MNHFAVYLELTKHCKSTILQLKKKKDRALIGHFQVSTNQSISFGRCAELLRAVGQEPIQDIRPWMEFPKGATANQGSGFVFLSLSSGEKELTVSY